MSEFTLQEFRKWYTDMISQHLDRDAFIETLEYYLTIYRHRLPLFPPSNYVKRDWGVDTYIFDGKIYQRKIVYSRADSKSEIFVEPTLCVGYTWLYTNDHSEGTPYLNRLVTGLTLPIETAPAVPAQQLGDKFLCNDGNHRIYAAYLRGEKVKLRVEGVHREIGSQL